MSTLRVRGACPRLSAPMETGDGLLARIVPAGPMTIDAFAGLCAAAETHGNGLMEVSARGGLQVRGLTPVSAPLFANTAASLAIDVCEDPSVIGSPLPNDPTAQIDAHVLARDIRNMSAVRGLVLAPKVSVAVDGGGRLHLDALTADIRLRAVPSTDGPLLHVSLGGDARSATPLGLVTVENAAALASDLLGVIAAQEADARASDVLRQGSLETFRAVAGDRVTPAAPLASRPQAETIGLHRLTSGLCAMGVALPFGQAHALDLIASVRMARANGAAWIATAPARTLLLGPITEMAAFALATAADSLGFIVDARDSRRRVAACPGAPACASGLIAARALAAEIANASAPSEDGIAVHVSGCAKGCAHPAAAPLTIVGTEQGCGLIHGGPARSRPDTSIDESTVVTEVVRLTSPETADA